MPPAARARRPAAQESDIRWASRWDTYLKMTDDQIHWFSIVNSVMIVLFLSGMVAMIMMRTLRSDIAKYNQLDQDDAAEETGWKLVGSCSWGQDMAWVQCSGLDLVAVAGVCAWGCWRLWLAQAIDGDALTTLKNPGSHQFGLAPWANDPNRTARCQPTWMAPRTLHS